MSKLFIQMLLSLVVAASAAVGLDPEVKGEVHKTLKEAKAFAHEMGESVIDAADGIEASAETSVDAAETSLESKAEVDVESEMEVELDVDFDKSSKKSDSRVEASAAAEAETETEVEAENLDLELENGLESDLELEVGIGN